MASMPFKQAVGRPRGVTMPCGWGCGADLTAREMRSHFVLCAKRPGGRRRPMLGSSSVKVKADPRYDYSEAS